MRTDGWDPGAPELGTLGSSAGGAGGGAAGFATLVGARMTEVIESLPNFEMLVLG